MKTEALSRLRSEALTLPKAERAELAHISVTSLNAPADTDATEEWDKEILHRIAEIDDGTAKYIDRDAFQRQMRDRIDD